MTDRDGTRSLAWFLRIMGVVELLALAAVVMPADTMAAIHAGLGLGDMPRDPLFGYLARSCSAFYAMMGVLHLYLSVDVQRNRHVIRFIAMMGVGFGLMLLIIDPLLGLPTWWCAVEGPVVMALCVVVLVLSRRVPGPAVT